jgi:hypothetical protein
VLYGRSRIPICAYLRAMTDDRATHYLIWGGQEKSLRLESSGNFLSIARQLFSLPFSSRHSKQLKQRERLEEAFYNPKSQAWMDVTTGDILFRCYNRGLLIQPEEGDIGKCLRHTFFVLAALETINGFIPTPRIDTSTLSDLIRLHHIDSLAKLLQIPISTFIQGILYVKGQHSPKKR